MQAEAAAQAADAAWVQASQQMSLTALLAASGWSGPQIAKYTGQAPNQFQSGPAPRGAHASGILNNPTGHWAMLGEQGPELGYVPQGASIFPNSSLGSMAGLLGGGGGTHTTQIFFDGQMVAQVVAPHMDAMVRAKFGPRSRS